MAILHKDKLFSKKLRLELKFVTQLLCLVALKLPLCAMVYDEGKDLFGKYIIFNLFLSNGERKI